MEVIATDTGFYLSLRKKGDQFILENESLFSSKWMKKVEPSPTSSEEPKPKRKKKDKEGLF